MDGRQLAAEVGVGGVVIGQLPVEPQGRSVLGNRQRRLAPPPDSTTAVPLSVNTRPLRTSAGASGAEARGSRMVRAWRYMDSASSRRFEWYRQ